MQSFPKPLSAKEEKACIERCQAGDREARNCLIEKNLRLVAYIAKKYNMGDKDMDDLISIGTIGLIKGIDTFDASKNIRLATYAARCIDNEVLMMLRASKKSAKDVYLYDSIGSDKEGNEINLIDVIEYEDEDVVERISITEQISHLNAYIDQALSQREKEIIQMRYGMDGKTEKTQREIASKYGISRSYVSRIEKRALEKLRKCYLDEEKRGDTGHKK
ncbi:MAG: RNA polymerase sporulation sigma factor SigK [Clostridiaceae bacterium]|nr:RNA polymerase sporulation sigma factor SigK [Clostridiaceae bacterium]